MKKKSTQVNLPSSLPSISISNQLAQAKPLQTRRATSPENKVQPRRPTSPTLHKAGSIQSFKTPADNKRDARDSLPKNQKKPMLYDLPNIQADTMKPETQPILENHEKFNDLLVLEPQELHIEESHREMLPGHIEDKENERNQENSRSNERGLNVFTTESDEDKTGHPEESKV